MSLVLISIVGCDGMIDENADGSETLSEDLDIYLAADEDDLKPKLSEEDLKQHLEVLDSLLTDGNPSDDAQIKMIKDLGGTLEYERWLETADEHEIRSKHEMYGLTYESSEPEASLLRSVPNELLQDCVKYFPSRFYGKTYSRSHEQITQKFSIDDQGRPYLSSVNRTLLDPKLLSQEESSTCQKKVRDWGGRGTGHGLTDQGGHLVGKALHGHGKRVNLTPQNGVINNSIFNGQIERIVRECNRGSFRYIDYRVYAVYPDAWGIRPESYIAEAITLYLSPRPKTTYAVARISNEWPSRTDSQQADAFVEKVKTGCGI